MSSSGLKLMLPNACLKEDDDVLALETGLVLKPMSCDSVGFSYLMAYGSCLDGGGNFEDLLLSVEFMSAVSR
jgi:hypothetical protein